MGVERWGELVKMGKWYNLPVMRLISFGAAMYSMVAIVNNI